MEEELVICQIVTTRAEYEAAREYLEAGHPGRPLVGVKALQRHPNPEEDAHFLAWLGELAARERELDGWFMQLVRGETTLEDLRRIYYEGEYDL